MVEQFLNHIHRHRLCKTSDKILLAVSGGVDSMVMLHLFLTAGFKVGVAHCNFQLRGAESDGDEAMVEKVCVQHRIPFFSQKFQTALLAEQAGKSIQIMARELRYGFFSEVRERNNYDFIATAHHINDNIETFLLNMVRGTGMDGLAGIPVKKERLIRPMLFATHAAVREYALKKDLSWREDSSNSTDDYNRNFVRHMVIPRLKELNPALEETFAMNAERIAAGIALAKKAIHEIRTELVSQQDDRLIIDREKLLVLQNGAVILWEMIKVYGFNYDQCKLMLKDHQSGKQFIANEHTLTVDRGLLIIQKGSDDHFEEVRIGKDEIFASNGSRKLLFLEHPVEKFSLRKDPHIAQLDADKIKFPLVWRPWKGGDTIVPLGMKNHKKISDILIDLKVALPDKQKITVLQSENDIVWVVGLRIHDHYKVTGETRKVLIIEMN